MDRSRSRRLLAGTLLGVSIALAACGTSGGDALVSSGSPGGEDGGDPVSAASCEAVRAMLLPRADEPVEAEPALTDEQAMAHLEDLADVVPADERADFDRVVELSQRFVEDPDAPAPDDTDEVLEVLDRLLPWAMEQCPPGYPVWACSVRGSFQPIGDRIEEDGTTNLSGPTYRSAEEGAQAWGADGERLVLAESDDSMTFAWLDDEGLVAEAKEFQLGPDGWVAGSSTECRSAHAAEPDFDSIGESISG